MQTSLTNFVPKLECFREASQGFGNRKAFKPAINRDRFLHEITKNMSITLIQQNQRDSKFIVKKLK